MKPSKRRLKEDGERAVGARLIVLAAISVAIAAGVGISLGRGVTVRSRIGELRIEPKQDPAPSPVAETFGAGSPISFGNGARADAVISGVVGSTHRARATNESRHSAAQYITHGKASPIAIGSDASSTAKMGEPNS
jgi:hypothetical protein